MWHASTSGMVAVSAMNLQNPQRIAQTSLPPKVVLLGSDRQTRGDLPLNPRDCVYWCARDMFGQIPYFDAWFELEPLATIRCLPIGEHYLRWLAGSDGPIYMQQRYGSVPNSIEYPLTEMVDEFGAYYLSPLSYMLALAIHSHFKEIELCGSRINSRLDTNVADRDARANVVYFLGVAKGRGIRVNVPSESILVRNSPRKRRNLKEEARRRLKKLRLQKRRLRQNHGWLTLLIWKVRRTKNRPDRVLLGLQSLLYTDLRFVDGQIRECAHLLSHASLFYGKDQSIVGKLRSLLLHLIEASNERLFGRIRRLF